jgi:ATP-binding cassette subfamily A (ABC1) protein 5
MFEKKNNLQEAMRMMGLYDSAYWISYFISDGILLGFLLSFMCAIISIGLFNNANFGLVLGMFFVYSLSAIPFGFFICSFFDTPQTAGQATLLLLLG